MKTGDQLKMFFIFMCLWFVTDGHDCGADPFIFIKLLADETGRTIEDVLQFTKEKLPADYETLKKKFREYARCNPLQRRGERGRELPGALQAAVGSSNTQRMLTGKRSVAAAAAGGGGDADSAAQGKSL